MRIKNPRVKITVVNPDPNCLINYDFLKDLKGFHYSKSRFSDFADEIFPAKIKRGAK